MSPTWPVTTLTTHVRNQINDFLVLYPGRCRVTGHASTDKVPMHDPAKHLRILNRFKIPVAGSQTKLFV